MALYDGFFDAALNEETNEYDRAYDSGDFTGYFEQFIGSGVCVYNNPDSMLVGYRDGGAVVGPGYLFLQGYWLKNDGDYIVPLPGAGVYAVVAHLDLGLRMITLSARAKADPEDYPDALVLAYVTVDAAGTGLVEDTRQNTALCGVIDAAGSLSGKVAYAVDYIDKEIDGKLAQAEADIAAQAALLDAKIAQVGNEVDKLAPPPIGTVKFSASRDVGAEWLPCDGRFINEAEYPELVAALGKLTPSHNEFSQILQESLSGEISNGVIALNRLWFFSFTDKRLYGLNLSTFSLSEISVTGIDELYSPVNNLIYLSITNGALFLCQQKAGLKEMVMVYKNYAFTGEETTLGMTRLTWELPGIFGGGGSLKYGKINITGAHYVVFDENDKLYKMCLGVWNYPDTNQAPQPKIMYQTWDVQDQIPVYPQNIRIGSSTRESYPNLPCAYVTANVTSNPATFYHGGPFGMAAFNKKNNDELIYPNNTINIESFPKGAYSIQASEATTTKNITRKNVVIASSQEVLAVVHKELNSQALTIGFVKQGGALCWIENPSVNAGVYASSFNDAAVYIAELNVWMIFLGTGFLFTQDLSDPGKYGFLDTTAALGIIISFGYVEYDVPSRTLYILGVDTANRVRIGKMEIPSLFEWANDGAWLPMIASDGVPAYIKAKEPAEGA